MLKMIKGCKVPQAKQLNEQYERTENKLIANVNANKIEAVFRHFITMQKEKMFFILELPVNELDERRLRKSESDPMHKDIYYIDGLDVDQALAILSRYGELLINDGLCQFGFASHDNSAELMQTKYNIMILWATKMERYADFFEAHHIFRVDHCITAWDTFTAKAPGKSIKIKSAGKSVFDLPNELADFGIYLAEQREE